MSPPDCLGSSGLLEVLQLSLVLPPGDALRPPQGEDLPADGKLRVGVKSRPDTCSRKSKKGDTLSMHYTGAWSVTLTVRGDAYH
jgi:hypothetical protein